jgi:hypothetical protein
VNEKRPSSFEVMVRLAPVAVFSMVTAALLSA